MTERAKAALVDECQRWQAFWDSLPPPHRVLNGDREWESRAMQVIEGKVTSEPFACYLRTRGHDIARGDAEILEVIAELVASFGA